MIPIVLHTCDSYKKYWNTWYYYMDKYVKKPYKQYFLSEEDAPDFIEHVTHIKTGKGEWGKRLLNGLAQIPEEHIFYMQEDFWPKQHMDLSPFFPLFQEYNMDALRITEKSYLYNLNHVKDKLYRFTQNAPYLMTHQFSLWNKKYFMKYIGADDSPWMNEIRQSGFIGQTLHAIYLIDEFWYNATVRGGILGDIGEKMVSDMIKDHKQKGDAVSATVD